MSVLAGISRWKKGKLTAAAAQEDARVSTTDEITRGDSILPELDVLTEFIGSCLIRWSSAEEFQGFEPIAAGSTLMMVKYWIYSVLKE